MLLRWFVNLYDLEIVEEEAFLKWREDVTDIYPGKGKALFQVLIYIYIYINDRQLKPHNCIT